MADQAPVAVNEPWDGERLDRTLRLLAAALGSHREDIFRRLVQASGSVADPAMGRFCHRVVDVLLAPDVSAEKILAEDLEATRAMAQADRGLGPILAATRALDRACLAVIDTGADAPPREDASHALALLGEQRLTRLLRIQEDDFARRLTDAQDSGARAAEQARELRRANEALKRSESRSQHRADQIALLSSAIHRLAPILDPERLMQEAANAVRSCMNHTFVAVVVLDHEGVLVGRWAARPGIGRTSTGRAQGPAGGLIGRALRKRAPQVVDDVTRDPDYHPDVPGTRSEMVIPLLEGGVALGAIDFQNEREGAFDLDAVAAGETLAEFLVVALRNARLLSEARGTAP